MRRITVNFRSVKEHPMFQAGDDIIYVNPKKERFPGRVLKVKKRVKISYEHPSGAKTGWVRPDHIELRETPLCAHNDECGWCADSGKCIYR
jgi:hypothetical protein